MLLVNTPVDEILFNKKNHGSLKTQIHYIDNHHVVSHYDGKKITVYDSLRNFTRVDRLNCQLRKTYFFFFRNKSYLHDVVYKVPQSQTNSTDCGLYAIAFATLLKSGISPCGVNLDSDRLRLHLLHCLKEGKLTFFQVIKTQKHSSKLSSNKQLFKNPKLDVLQKGESITSIAKMQLENI